MLDVAGPDIDPNYIPLLDTSNTFIYLFITVIICIVGIIVFIIINKKKKGEK